MRRRNACGCFRGAITAFTRCMSRELGQHGICVNTLAPGYTLSDTGLTNTVHVEQSKAAAVARRALKRDQYPEEAQPVHEESRRDAVPRCVGAGTEHW